MRFIIFVVMGFVFAASFVTQAAAHNYAMATCVQHFVCADANSAAIATLVAGANACVTQNFGYTSATGFFDPSAGLDSNNCLVPLPDVLPKGAGTPLIPACCARVLPNGSDCVFDCALNGAN